MRYFVVKQHIKGIIIILIIMKKSQKIIVNKLDNELPMEAKSFEEILE